MSLHQQAKRATFKCDTCGLVSDWVSIDSNPINERPEGWERWSYHFAQGEKNEFGNFTDRPSLEITIDICRTCAQFSRTAKRYIGLKSELTLREKAE